MSTLLFEPFGVGLLYYYFAVSNRKSNKRRSHGTLQSFTEKSATAATL